MGNFEGGDALPESFGGPAGFDSIRIGQQGDEFFTAIACQQFAAALQSARKRVGDRLQAFVPRLMAVRVVEKLEIIDVHEDNGDRALGFAGSPPFGFQRGVEESAIGNAGQSVEIGDFCAGP